MRRGQHTFRPDNKEESLADVHDKSLTEHFKQKLITYRGT